MSDLCLLITPMMHQISTKSTKNVSNNDFENYEHPVEDNCDYENNEHANACNYDCDDDKYSSMNKCNALHLDKELNPLFLTS